MRRARRCNAGSLRWSSARLSGAPRRMRRAMTVFRVCCAPSQVSPLQALWKHSRQPKLRQKPLRGTLLCECSGQEVSRRHSLPAPQQCQSQLRQWPESSEQKGSYSHSKVVGSRGGQMTPSLQQSELICWRPRLLPACLWCGECRSAQQSGAAQQGGRRPWRSACAPACSQRLGSPTRTGRAGAASGFPRNPTGRYVFTAHWWGTHGERLGSVVKSWGVCADGGGISGCIRHPVSNSGAKRPD